MISAFVFFWLIIAVFFLLFEIGHPGLFFFLSFFFASIFSAMVALFEMGLIAQAAVFLIGFVISFIFLRRAAKKMSFHVTRTNVYALEGRKGLVIATIFSDNPGQVKVNGEIWMARSLHDQVLPAGTHVIVVNVSGVHLVVKKIENN